MEPNSLPKWSYSHFIAEMLWQRARDDNEGIDNLVTCLEALPPKLRGKVKRHLLRTIREDKQRAEEALAALNPHRSEECPGCGRKPGEGINPLCSHSLGCGFYQGN